MTMSTREIIARVIFRFHFWFLITILTKHTCTCDMALGLATLSRHHACLAQLEYSTTALGVREEEGGWS